MASGLNQNRRGLERVRKMAERGELKKLLIEYPDRLARFGYAYLDRHLKHCGVEIEVTSQKEPEDAHAELVQDLKRWGRGLNQLGYEAEVTVTRAASSR